MQPRHYQLYVGGNLQEADSGMRFDSVNPYTGEVWATVPDGGPTDIDKAVHFARSAIDGEWGRLTGFERAELMRELAVRISENAEALAQAEVADTGKLYREMKLQVGSLNRWVNYFAGFADKLEGRTIPVPKADQLVYTVREPVGVVGAIIPWNAPLTLLMMKLAPSLASGCSMVVKPSEHAPASTLAFAEVFHQVGFPPGVLNVVTSSDPLVGAALSGHPGVDKVVFTGSSVTGASVARAAGTNVNGVVLELGGKSPQIVFEDADLAEAAQGIVAGIFAAAGQSCMAGSRLLVHSSVASTLVTKLVGLTETIRAGDPADPTTELGPISNRPQFERILSLIRDAEQEGAHVALGGSADPDNGDLFVQPTIFTEVTNDMRIAREEVFGPVLCVITFDSEEEAVRLANDTEYGLAAGIWTSDIRRGHRVAAKVRAGTVWVNTYRAVAASVPFGGFKASGLGRENGLETLNEYTETKSIWLNLSDTPRDPFTLG